MCKKTISFFLTLGIFLLTNCFVEEEYTFKERITGKWAFSGRTAFLNDGSSMRNLPVDVCEFETEFTLYEDGTLNYEDYKEKGIHDGTVDFCEEDLLTNEEGLWNIFASEDLRIILKNTEDGSDIIIEPYDVNILNEDELNIRYKEFENTQDKEISYYIYHYLRIHN